MKTMRKLAVMVLSAIVLATGFVSMASAQFSAATNYMSNAGYARYLNHVQTGQWTLVP